MAGGRREIVLTPIEVAIDEMQTKVSSLREVINNPLPNAMKLQLNLQGCVSAQVSACLLYTSPSPRDDNRSRMPSSA